MQVQRKTILITGAAAGIGFGIAERLAAEGANIVLTDIDGPAARAAATTLGGNVVPVESDASERESVRQSIDVAVKSFGRLDVIFNNAGFNRPEPFLDITENVWNAIIKVNSWGVLVGMQEAAKQFIAQGEGGKIVNTASIAGRSASPEFAPYCASKAAVISLTQAAARAFARYGITVNAFGPGVVETPLWEQLDKDLYEMGASAAPGAAMSSMANGILLGRTAIPADIAGTALFLASRDSDYMTGQILLIDGGMVLQ